MYIKKGISQKSIFFFEKKWLQICNLPKMKNQIAKK